MKTKSLWIGLALLGSAAATPAFAAATQGTLGATSTGSITITVSVPSRVQITGLSDVAFTGVDPAQNATNTQNTCVWSNTATKGYTVTATGSGTGSAFTLANTTLTPVAYTVQWAGSTGQATGTGLTSGAASATYNSTATTPTCATAPLTTASLIVNISSTQLLTMASNTTYTGVLTLVVSPV